MFKQQVQHDCSYIYLFRYHFINSRGNYSMIKLAIPMLGKWVKMRLHQKLFKQKVQHDFHSFSFKEWDFPSQKFLWNKNSTGLSFLRTLCTSIRNSNFFYVIVKAMKHKAKHYDKSIVWEKNYSQRQPCNNIRICECKFFSLK